VNIGRVFITGLILCNLISQPAAALANGSAYYDAVLAANVAYVDSLQLSDGAITDNRKYIEPYFANQAAIALTLIPAQIPYVRSWMRWYIGHLNAHDVWGLTGTVYVYDVADDATAASRNNADSTDAYAATFLSVAYNAWQRGDTVTRSFVRDLIPELDKIAAVEAQTLQPNGLTWAKPSYRVEYLEDNCQVYRGLADYAMLLAAVGDKNGSARYAREAQTVLDAIQSVLWVPSQNEYAFFVNEKGKLVFATAKTAWYAGVAELFPIIYGVISPSSDRAKSLYGRFNAEFPNWDTLDKPDAFPQANVAYAAVLMNDTSRATRYVQSVTTKYQDRGFPWPWHVGESAWLIPTAKRLNGDSDAL
jgi:hypothetical protein